MAVMRIDNAQIHLWQLDQSDFDLPSVQDACLSWLTEAELLRYHRFQFDRHRKQLLLGRILMRAALSNYDNSISPEAWIFTYNAYGKPQISTEQNSNSLYFNVSHSAQKVVLAVSRCADIGVDLEFSDKQRRVEAIAHRYFAGSEVAQLLALPAEEQQIRFYELWTLKEAYIKACGMGLAIPLQHFAYSFHSGGKLALEFDAQRGDSESAWQLWQLEAGLDYKLALAAKTGAQAQPNKLVGWQMLSLDSIVGHQLQIIRSKQP
ncbi:MAG: 4'-phosphopantetheinyl transferase superfamily protein [Pseudomonadales bacterium]|nr:4'-phosphopantetheinyl transferase superfamily protein [Pseudomonadales bacterium]